MKESIPFNNKNAYKLYKNDNFKKVRGGVNIIVIFFQPLT